MRPWGAGQASTPGPEPQSSLTVCRNNYRRKCTLRKAAARGVVGVSMKTWLTHACAQVVYTVVSAFEPATAHAAKLQKARTQHAASPRGSQVHIETTDSSAPTCSPPALPTGRGGPTGSPLLGFCRVASPEICCSRTPS